MFDGGRLHVVLAARECGLVRLTDFTGTIDG
jgi:hypothetical protein